MLAQVRGHVKCFDDNKIMSFWVTNNKLIINYKNYIKI